MRKTHGYIRVMYSGYTRKPARNLPFAKGNVLFNRYRLMACLDGGGGPQLGEVTQDGSPRLSCKRDEIKTRDYMDRRVTSPKRVTSPTWGPPPLCKQTQEIKSCILL